MCVRLWQLVEGNWTEKSRIAVCTRYQVVPAGIGEAFARGHAVLPSSTVTTYLAFRQTPHTQFPMLLLLQCLVSYFMLYYRSKWEGKGRWKVRISRVIALPVTKEIWQVVAIRERSSSPEESANHSDEDHAILNQKKRARTKAVRGVAVKTDSQWAKMW